MSGRRWLFVCSCIALVTSAFTFIVRGDVLPELGRYFAFTQAERGWVESAVFVGMALSMFGGGFICDLLGIRRIMFLAFVCHLLGSAGTIFAPELTGYSQSQGDNNFVFYWLYVASLLMGFGNGFTEVGINPLVATLYPDKKTHFLNILHAWWPGGLVIGGIMAQWVVRSVFPEGAMGLTIWQTSIWLIVLPTLVYGAMLIPAVFPASERVASGVSTKDMMLDCLRPLFLIWAFCMLLTASTELGTQKWLESIIRSTADFSGTMVVVCTSGMMFLLRFFLAGPLTKIISPVGLMFFSAVLSAIGLYALSYADSVEMVFLTAFIYGLGIAYFWPTMLGVVAERFPKSGALGLSLTGSAGNLAIAFAIPLIGNLADIGQVNYVQENAAQYEQELLTYNEKQEPEGLDSDKIGALKDAAEETPQEEPPEILQVANAALAYGYSVALRQVSLIPTILIVLFGAIWLYDFSRGGYKPEVLLSQEEHDELYSGGIEGPVE